jgi:hypothetical protein
MRIQKRLYSKPSNLRTEIGKLITPDEPPLFWLQIAP